MRVVKPLVQGAIAGAGATVAMSAVMAGASGIGAVGRNPPTLIARTLLPGGGSRRQRPGEGTVAAVAHMGFGMGAGAVFGLLTQSRAPSRGSGTAYAFAVWLASYEGWVPALGIQPPAHRDAPGRAVTVLAAHVVYGAALARLLRRARR